MKSFLFQFSVSQRHEVFVALALSQVLSFDVSLCVCLDFCKEFSRLFSLFVCDVSDFVSMAHSID